MNKVNVIINETDYEFKNIEILKSLKNNLHIILQDFSCLSTEQIRKISYMLKMKRIEFANQKAINIEEYIAIRNEIESVIQKISGRESEPEKFLKIYQYLGKEFTISEEGKNIQNRTCTTFQMCELLQNCLKCVKINSNMILGKELEDDKKHYWNQVELDKKWYNADVVSDMENIKKNRTEYCLLGDKAFFETHAPKVGINNYCAEDFNPKLVNVFFKTGLFKEKLLSSYIEVILEKIKKLLAFNKKQEVLALPEAKKERKK